MVEIRKPNNAAYGLRVLLSIVAMGIAGAVAAFVFSAVFGRAPIDLNGWQKYVALGLTVLVMVVVFSIGIKWAQRAKNS